MPPPIPPYRISFGERNGKESYIIQSTKGVSWDNLPGDLEAIIKATDAEILDVSLGSAGRYYVKYRQDGIWKRSDSIPPVVLQRDQLTSLPELSRGLWAETEQNPDDVLDRLTLGPGTQHWGVMTLCKNDDEYWDRPFADTTALFRDHFRAQKKPGSGYDSVKFVALSDLGDWAFNIDGRVMSSGPRSFREAMKDAKDHGKENVAFSRVDRGWVIVMDDGSVVHQLSSKAISDAVNTFMRPLFCLPGSSVAPQAIRHLLRTDPMYAQLSRWFYGGWKHPDKPRQQIAYISTVILTDKPASSYQEYKDVLARKGYERGNEQFKFHGTRRVCSLGESPLASTRPCSSRLCNLCGILRTSFKMSRAGTAPGRNFLRFGHGIYTTSVSSKADDYNGNPSSSPYKAMLVARVLLGRGAIKYRTNEAMIAPPRGFHSVRGEVGGDLVYDEQVVYHDDAIRPAFLIMYEERDSEFEGTGV